MKKEKNFELYLRAFELTDLEKLNALRNDDEAFLYTCGNKFFISKEYDRKWIEDKIFNNQYQIYLSICLSDTKELIGYICIIDIDYRNRKAQWGGINIDKNSSGKGYATKAASLMIKFVFEELGFNKLYGYVIESHSVSIRMLEKLGFVKEGLIHDFVYKKNQFHNAYFVSLLKDEYNIKLNGK